jgi:hypothetical protein
MMIDVFEVAFFRAAFGLLAVAHWLGALAICAATLIASGGSIARIARFRL